MSFTISEIIQLARDRIGDKEEVSVGEQYVPDEAIKAEMGEAIVECNQIFGAGGTGGGRKEVSFLMVTGQQHYSISDSIGTDVRDIKEVIRSDAYVSDSALEPMMVDPRTGIPTSRSAFIDQAYQQDVLDVIVSTKRWQRNDQYDWQRLTLSGTDTLRLMPPPTQDGTVVVTYISSGEDVSDLPDSARDAMSNAACVALLDCMLNRVNSSPPGSSETARDRRYWIEMVERQRDRYEAKYRRALDNAPNH